LLKEALPGLSRIAALCNAPDPSSKPFLEQVQLAGKAHQVEITPFLVTAGAELHAAFPAMVGKKINAVIVQPILPQKEIADLAIRHHLPTGSPSEVFPKNGGLMGYAQDNQHFYRISAVLVDKILKGAKPADLPVEQPTRFRLVINLKTAKALGLTVPATLLARADEVIE
jgi:putative ABC transport system substrate-binding protein